MQKRTVTVPNISCGHCVHTIESELRELSGILLVKADQQTKAVEIEWDSRVSWEEIRDLLHEINYPPED